MKDDQADEHEPNLAKANDAPRDTSDTRPRPATPAGRGRPRCASTSTAILEATLDLIADLGSIQAVSIEAVAAKAGVSKATIYRRWPNKSALLSEAIHSMKQPLPAELPGRSIREDLILIGKSFRTDFSERDRAVIRAMTLELAVNPTAMSEGHKPLDKRREFIRAVIAAGIERGEVRPDIDLQLALAMFISPLMAINIYQVFPDLHGREDLVESVVDNLLAGIAATTED
ncbi:TetR/AcrR family transcriptional regulator [Natronoglycomyces albus]|uniref:TetR/AcrR family transcriptional regulator n=1 Tax=Natronoglycomyces albus TaxID=2811108 RepID=A0A895XM22_9ACTN|nr:TetR/AcrR family transcriptional regulator [Natronoglycomyces albus]QSB06394.1 TetR/AcrR family transcriptional regulator [Natronoglycomyces albus]